MLLFGGSDSKITSFEDARTVIVPVPYGETVTYMTGTENGPSAILEASNNMELFDEELNKETYETGIHTLPLLEVSGLKPEEMIGKVEASVSDILKHGKMPVVLGGEHSVSIGAVKAVKDIYKDVSVLYFDAHHDMRDSYGGSRYNHACVARRVLEIAPLAEVGVRSLSLAEFDFLAGKDIKIINMQYMMKNPGWHDTVREYLSGHVYISIDMDVFDPSIMLSVGTPEPGGMLWQDFLASVRNIIKGKKIVGFDAVELCPIKGIVAPDFMAAKLIYKLIGYTSP